MAISLTTCTYQVSGGQVRLSDFPGSRIRAFGHKMTRQQGEDKVPERAPKSIQSTSFCFSISAPSAHNGMQDAGGERGWSWEETEEDGLTGRELSKAVCSCELGSTRSVRGSEESLSSPCHSGVSKSPTLMKRVGTLWNH